MAIPSRALSKQAERAKLCETLDPWKINAADFGIDPILALRHRIGVQLTDAGRSPKPVIAEDAKTFTSDTGQLRWDVSKPGAGYFVADTPRTKLFTGFVAGRTFALGPVQLKIGKTRLDWTTVSMVSIDGAGFDRAGRILVAATGWVQNRDAVVERLP
ncbi:MAG: hypothetical protein ABIK89_05390, partial [Planctomycetota bacterium]